jgi:hypothetical protein
VFQVGYEHHLHIKEESCPRNRPQRSLAVSPVRYEHRLHIKIKLSVTGRGGI